MLAALAFQPLAPRLPTAPGAGRVSLMPHMIMYPMEDAPDSDLYAQLEGVLKEAERGAGLGAAQARSLRKRWLDLSPEELTESALVMGASIGVDFEKGIQLIETTEDKADAIVPARGYAALMRLGVASQQYLEVQGLLGLSLIHI